MELANQPCLRFCLVKSRPKGTIAIEKNATIGFLPQETAAAGDETVLELALAVSPELVHAQKVIKEHEG